jgi:hypothetical protein
MVFLRSHLVLAVNLMTEVQCVPEKYESSTKDLSSNIFLPVRRNCVLKFTSPSGEPTAQFRHRFHR